MILVVNKGLSLSRSFPGCCLDEETTGGELEGAFPSLLCYSELSLPPGYY
jgi:hypothetical protein